MRSGRVEASERGRAMKRARSSADRCRKHACRRVAGSCPPGAGSLSFFVANETCAAKCGPTGWSWGAWRAPPARHPSHRRLGCRAGHLVVRLSLAPESFGGRSCYLRAATTPLGSAGFGCEVGRAFWPTRREPPEARRPRDLTPRASRKPPSDMTCGEKRLFATLPPSGRRYPEDPGTAGRLGRLLCRF